MIIGVNFHFLDPHVEISTAAWVSADFVIWRTTQHGINLFFSFISDQFFSVRVMSANVGGTFVCMDKIEAGCKGHSTIFHFDRRIPQMKLSINPVPDNHPPKRSLQLKTRWKSRGLHCTRALRGLTISAGCRGLSPSVVAGQWSSYMTARRWQECHFTKSRPLSVSVKPAHATNGGALGPTSIGVWYAGLQ